MLIAGSDDGAYRLTGIHGADDATVRRVLDSGRVMRLRAFDGVDGYFAATATGLFHSPDGEDWTDLRVPTEKVYSVGASPDGHRLYAGTRPARVYVAGVNDRATLDPAPGSGLAWTELDGFRDLPSRGEWRLPRHEDLAQVRDVHAPDDDGRVVAGVEVGGVHLSGDGGGTWTERRDGVDDDVHELHAVGPDEWVAATGFGLFRTADAGRSWTRLDDGYDQRYFRSVHAHDGTIYAGAALSNSANWEDPDADPELFACRDGESLEPVGHPRPDETVTGLASVDGTLVAATHRGTVLVGPPGDWTAAGSIPVADDQTGRYTPLTWVEG